MLLTLFSKECNSINETMNITLDVITSHATRLQPMLEVEIFPKELQITTRENNYITKQRTLS